MSSTSPPELTGSTSHIGFDRIYSAETDDSPFGSSLVTPTDEELYANQGLHERLDAAETILGYFGSKIISEETDKDIYTSNGIVGEVLDSRQSEQGSDEINRINMSPSLSSNLDSTKALESMVLSSSSSESIQRPISKGLYTLPNDHIIVEPGSSDSPQIDVQKPINSDSIPLIKQLDLGIGFWFKELAPANNSLTRRALILIAFRLICFLPWCIAVGGTLILSPDHVELVVFRTGYLETLSGIRRYSHFAEYGFHHIVAFLTFLGMVIWIMPTAGLLCIGGLAAQFCWAWNSFLVDHNVPLGEDDRQMVYLLATTTWLNDTTVNIQKIDDSYYATEKATKELHTVSEGDSGKKRWKVGRL